MEPRELIKNLGFKRVSSDTYGEEEEVYTINGSDEDLNTITLFDDKLIEFYNAPFQFSEDNNGYWSRLRNEDDDYMSITIGPKHYDKIPMIAEFWKDSEKARDYIIEIMKKRAEGVKKVLTEFDETLGIFNYHFSGSDSLLDNRNVDFGLIAYNDPKNFNYIGFEVNPLDLALECVSSYSRQDLFPMDSGDFLLFLYNRVFHDENGRCMYPDEAEIFKSL